MADEYDATAKYKMSRANLASDPNYSQPAQPGSDLEDDPLMELARIIQQETQVSQSQPNPAAIDGNRLVDDLENQLMQELSVDPQPVATAPVPGAADAAQQHVEPANQFAPQPVAPVHGSPDVASAQDPDMAAFEAAFAAEVDETVPSQPADMAQFDAQPAPVAPVHPQSPAPGPDFGAAHVVDTSHGGFELEQLPREVHPGDPEYPGDIEPALRDAAQSVAPAQVPQQAPEIGVQPAPTDQGDEAFANAFMRELDAVESQPTAQYEPQVAPPNPPEAATGAPQSAFADPAQQAEVVVAPAAPAAPEFATADFQAQIEAEMAASLDPTPQIDLTPADQQPVPAQHNEPPVPQAPAEPVTSMSDPLAAALAELESPPATERAPLHTPAPTVAPESVEAVGTEPVPQQSVQWAAETPVETVAPQPVFESQVTQPPLAADPVVESGPVEQTGQTIDPVEAALAELTNFATTDQAQSSGAAPSDASFVEPLFEEPVGEQSAPQGDIAPELATTGAAVGATALDPAVDDNFDYVGEEDGEDEQRSGGGLKVAAVILAVALFGGLGALAWNFVGGSETAQPAKIVLASDDPVKVKPEQPGGQTIPNQDQAVYNEVSGEGETKPPQTALKSGSTEPIALEPAGDKSTERLTASSNDENKQGLDAVTPRRVRTVVVKPDGTILLPAADGAAPNTAEPSTEVAALTRGINPQPRATDSGTQPQNSAASSTSGTGTETTSSTEPTTAVFEGGSPATGKIPLPTFRNPNDAPAQPVQTAAVQPQPAATSQPAPSAATSAWAVQISSQRSEADAKASYANLRRRFSSVIGDRGYDIRRATVGEKGVFYRVRVHAKSRNDAIALCQRYERAGGSCFASR
ncbi:MAG: SPOR domain-containing protein [Pseudomonadota bacterium]